MKVPTRSATHQEVDATRIPGMGLELEDLAKDDEITLADLIELAEQRGRPASHYLAAIPLATELRLATGGAPLVARVCAGNCQRIGALELLDHLVDKHDPRRVAIAPIECLDQCDLGPAIELHGAHGKLVLAPATIASLDEAISQL